MKNNIYTGVRYTPLFAGNWDKLKTYEHLTIVMYQGNSYTSKKAVPKNVDINNQDFWANTGNYNAQLQIYINEVKQLRKEVDELKKKVGVK